MVYAKSIQAVIQNLKDAGCDPEFIERFLSLDKQGKMRAQIQLLEKHRSRLLNDMHEEQRRIDCLDYLMHQMERWEHEDSHCP